MIKIIITITALLVSMLVFSQKNGKIGQADFRGKGCNGGSGFCNEPRDTIINNKSTTMKNYIAYRKDYNVVMFELDPKTLNREDQQRFFGKEYAKITPNETLEFVQDDDYIFDINMMIYLDLDLGWRMMKKGNYPLKIVDDKVQITITLSMYR